MPEDRELRVCREHHGRRDGHRDGPEDDGEIVPSRGGGMERVHRSPQGCGANDRRATCLSDRRLLSGHQSWPFAEQRGIGPKITLDGADFFPTVKKQGQTSGVRGEFGRA